MYGLTIEDGRLVFAKKEATISKASPDPAASRVLRQLRAFLDPREPELVRFLVNFWNAQGRAITYREIREAILSGDISGELIEAWQQDYSRFVVKYLQPRWEQAIVAGTADLAAKYPEWHFDPMADGVREWTETRSAQFVTNSTTEQIDAIRAVVRRAASLEDMTVDELSRVIRAMVGLTEPQARANMRYYENLLGNGMSEQRARDLSIRYSARQHRYRAYNIARTELAFAYNSGAHIGTKQAQERGYMGEVVKIWCTAGDERVCPICGSLGRQGKRIPMDADIYYEYKDRDGNIQQRRINPKLNDPEVGKHPPAHPSCRCAVLYKEVAPPRSSK